MMTCSTAELFNIFDGERTISTSGPVYYPFTADDGLYDSQAPHLPMCSEGTHISQAITEIKGKHNDINSKLLQVKA